VLAKRGIELLPDIIANAGGVTVSYYELDPEQAHGALERDGGERPSRAGDQVELPDHPRHRPQHARAGRATHNSSRYTIGKDLDMRHRAMVLALKRIEAHYHWRGLSIAAAARSAALRLCFWLYSSWLTFRRHVREPAAALVEDDRPPAPARVGRSRGSTVAEMRVRVGGRRHRRLAGEAVLAHPLSRTLDLAAHRDCRRADRARASSMLRGQENGSRVGPLQASSASAKRRNFTPPKVTLAPACLATGPKKTTRLDLALARVRGGDRGPALVRGPLPFTDLPQHVSAIATLRHWLGPRLEVRSSTSPRARARRSTCSTTWPARRWAFPFGSAERANLVLLSAIAISYPYSLRSLLRALGVDTRLALFGCALSGARRC